MKKVLSILISVMMVAGLFVALVPTASAAVTQETAPQMPETGLLVYTEDFEGEELYGADEAALANDDLIAALGWKQAKDIAPVTVGDVTYDAYAQEGLSGTGTAELLYDEEAGDHRVALKVGTQPDGYGWGVQFVNNERLAGADYMVEFSLIIESVDNASGWGINFRNNTPWRYTQTVKSEENPDIEEINSKVLSDDTTMVYNIQVKRNGQYDMHYIAPGGFSTATRTGGNQKVGFLYQLEGVNHTKSSTVEGAEYDATLGNNKDTIVGLENQFRLVVDADMGTHMYVMNQETGEWLYFFGMDETAAQSFAANKQYIGSGINFIMRTAVKWSVDDLSVYTIADEDNDPTVEMVGYQTAAAAEGVDTRIIAKIGNLSENNVVAEVRYEICINEEIWADVWLENAYKEITASYGAEAIVAGEGELLTALHVTGCPANTSFSVTPYVTFADGATLIGEALDFTVGA